MRCVLCMVLLCQVQPAPVEAQDASCTYASCALRIDEGFFRTRFLAGERGDEVARVGGFGTNLEKQLALPDSAIFHVRRANSRMRTGGILSVIGAAGMLYATLATGEPDANRVVAVIVGGGSSIAGAVFTRSSRNELSRAVWWYNQQFAR
jgi:hypothetical protein